MRSRDNIKEIPEPSWEKNYTRHHVMLLDVLDITYTVVSRLHVSEVGEVPHGKKGAGNHPFNDKMVLKLCRADTGSLAPGVPGASSKVSGAIFLSGAAP